MAEQWKIDMASSLRGARLHRMRWTQKSEGWDHDHCAACWAIFAVRDGPDIQYEGYAACDEDDGVYRHWVCLACFNELKSEMGWIENQVKGTPKNRTELVGKLDETSIACASRPSSFGSDNPL
jgi:hypothetical protein